MVYKTGDEDICYYNFYCAHQVGFLSAFNNVYSNIGYILLGILFILLVYRRQVLSCLTYISKASTFSSYSSIKSKQAYFFYHTCLSNASTFLYLTCLLKASTFLHIKDKYFFILLANQRQIPFYLSCLSKASTFSSFTCYHRQVPFHLDFVLKTSTLLSYFMYQVAEALHLTCQRVEPGDTLTTPIRRGRRVVENIWCIGAGEPSSHPVRVANLASL